MENIGVWRRMFDIDNVGVWWKLMVRMVVLDKERRLMKTFFKTVLRMLFEEKQYFVYYWVLYLYHLQN